MNPSNPFPPTPQVDTDEYKCIVAVAESGFGAGGERERERDKSWVNLNFQECPGKRGGGKDDQVN